MRQGLQSVVGLQSELVQQVVPITYTLETTFFDTVSFKGLIPSLFRESKNIVV